MNQIDAVLGQYVKTILDLQARIASAAAELADSNEKLEAANKELSELKEKGNEQIRTDQRRRNGV